MQWFKNGMCGLLQINMEVSFFIQMYNSRSALVKTDIMICKKYMGINTGKTRQKKTKVRAWMSDYSPLFMWCNHSSMPYSQCDLAHLCYFTDVLHGEFNTLRPRQNGRHFPDNIFKCIFFNENLWILLKISLKFVPEVRINNIPSLVQIMIVWTNDGLITDAYMRHSASMS